MYVHGLVVGEDRAGLAVRRQQQEAADRVAAVARERPAPRVSAWCPLAIAATCRTRIDRLRGSVISSSSSGK